MVDGAGVSSTLFYSRIIFAGLNQVYWIIPSILNPTMTGSIFNKKKLKKNLRNFF